MHKKSKSKIINNPIPRRCVLEIESIAKAITGHRGYSSVYENITIMGNRIDINGVSGNYNGRTSGDLRDDELRGCYGPIRGNIDLFLFGFNIPNSHRSKEHILALIGHELIHALQDKFSLVTCKQISMASKFGQVYSKSRNPNDYANYIGTEVELPAHAMMVALEMRKYKPGIFATRVKMCSKFQYICRKLHGSRAKHDLVNRLLVVAAQFHRNFWPCAAKSMA